jgi:hypothetical protein
VYSNASRLAVSLPERTGRLVFQTGARLAERIGTQSRETVAANLSQVLGQPADSPVVRGAVHEAFSLYGRYWHESFRFGSMSDAEFDKRMVAEGFEYIDQALEKGKGAVLVAPHMGNWDAAGRWLGSNGFNVVTVAEALKPEETRRAVVWEALLLIDPERFAAQLDSIAPAHDQQVKIGSMLITVNHRRAVPALRRLKALVPEKANMYEEYIREFESAGGEAR